MTEHILSFSIGLDDASIIENVKRVAEKQIINDIKADVLNKIFEGRYYNHKAVTTDNYTGNVKLDSCAGLNDFAKDIVKSAIADMKDEIVERAAEKLADSYKRTKVWKEKAEGIVGGE